jgi:hypothetical protein
VARRGGGTASATTAVEKKNSLALAEALWRRSSQGWMFDVRRQGWRGRRCCRAGGYESRCWTARLEGGGRATRSIVVATEDDDDGWDLHPPPARRRWMRRCRCPLRPTTETTKTRREGGGGDDKGQASGDDSPSRRDTLELEAWWWEVW